MKSKSQAGSLAHRSGNTASRARFPYAVGLSLPPVLSPRTPPPISHPRHHHRFPRTPRHFPGPPGAFPRPIIHFRRPFFGFPRSSEPFPRTFFAFPRTLGRFPRQSSVSPAHLAHSPGVLASSPRPFWHTERHRTGLFQGIWTLSARFQPIYGQLKHEHIKTQHTHLP